MPYRVRVGTGVTWNMTFREARIFQSNLHRLMECTSTIECFSVDHEPTGWCTVAKTKRGVGGCPFVKG